MNKISQSEHIEALIANSNKRSIMADEIQKAYIHYLQETNDPAFNELIKLLDDFCISWIRNQLWKSGCYNDYNLDTTLQDSRMAVWKLILNDKEENITRDKFTYYSFGIYKKKTLDIIRKISRQKATMDTISLDAPVGDNDISIIDLIPIEHQNIGEQEEYRHVNIEVYKIYCTAFMNSKNAPQSLLALYYARVLPHLLKEIPDSKGTSAKWAYNRMGDRSIGELGKDSEKTLQKEINKELYWGEPFTSQINSEAKIAGAVGLLKDVIYTANFSQAKIEDWADSMHKMALKKALELVSMDKTLHDLVIEYAAENYVLMNFISKSEVEKNESFNR